MIAKRQWKEHGKTEFDIWIYLNRTRCIRSHAFINCVQHSPAPMCLLAVDASIIIMAIMKHAHAQYQTQRSRSLSLDGRSVRLKTAALVGSASQRPAPTPRMTANEYFVELHVK